VNHASPSSSFITILHHHHLHRFHHHNKPSLNIVTIITITIITTLNIITTITLILEQHHSASYLGSKFRSCPMVHFGGEKGIFFFFVKESTRITDSS